MCLLLFLINNPFRVVICILTVQTSLRDDDVEGSGKESEYVVISTQGKLLKCGLRRGYF